MAEIDEFAKRVAADFRQSQRFLKPPHNLQLSSRAVEDIVRTVFDASLISDEGRYPTVSLLSYLKTRSTQLHFSFRGSKPLTASEIAKLSHGLSASSHLCLLSDKGRLVIGGIHVTMLDEMRHFGYSSNRTANPLKLVIWGPGHIEVSTGGIALIYRAGGIFEETPLRAADLLQALARSVETELTGKTRGTIESLDHVFGDLIQEIGRLGHGGLLLVTKVPKKKEFFSWRKTHGSLLQKLLIKYWDDVATLTSSAGGLSKLLSTQSHPKLGKQFLTVSSDTTMLQNCVGAIATLAGMDGAIVMDHGCNVVAFNAIISKTAKRSRGARVVDEIGRKLSEKAIVGERGSRHQSALAYVKRVPNSFAFVISQDGGVSAFHNQGDGTVRYEGGLRIFS